MSSTRRRAALTAWRRIWSRLRRPIGRLSIAALVLCLVFGAWPYSLLWQLEQAVAAGDQQRLSTLVDLEAVRESLGRRLNKERPSDMGPVSDAFIDWLESGLRQTGPEHLLDRKVTLDWISQLLRAKCGTDRRIFSNLSHAFFESPSDFRVHIGAKDANPLILRLHRQGLGWRISMLYY